MIDTRYTYSSARVKALERTLLSEAQLERLLGAKTVPETFKVLQDTFLAEYLGEHERSNFPLALDMAIVDAKDLLARIAPDPEILDILWLKYDFLNLKTIIKGDRAGMSDDEILGKCFRGSKYPPERLISLFREQKLGTLDRLFEEARNIAAGAKHVYDIDIAMNICYFRLIHRIAAQKQNPFVSEFVALLTDLFNLKTALRAERLKEIGIAPVFISGGRFREKDLTSEKQVLEQFKKVGGEAVWQAAIAEYESAANHSLIEKTADEYIVAFLKEKSFSIFSPAPLFSFFTARKNNVQTVAAIMTEKQAGLKEGEIRHILRRLYK